MVCTTSHADATLQIPTAAATSASLPVLDPAASRYPDTHQTGQARRDHDHIGSRTGWVFAGRMRRGVLGIHSTHCCPRPQQKGCGGSDPPRRDPVLQSLRRHHGRRCTKANGECDATPHRCQSTAAQHSEGHSASEALCVESASMPRRLTVEPQVVPSRVILRR